MRSMSRRGLIRGLGGTGAVLAFSGIPVASLGDEVVEPSEKLKPGEFTWHPERSPVGPLAIIVSLPEQRVHVYRNGIRIAVSTCSTGKPGHDTPTGVFTILQKDKHHRSSTYNNAPMPNMNRLTWSGVALHAGNLPGYPASHGCIRLPMKFSELLFTVTHVGTPVIVAGSHAEPEEVVHPGLVLANYAEHEFDSVQQGLKGKPLPWQTRVTSADDTCAVLVSHADEKAYVLVNGAMVVEGPVAITDPQNPLGRHVFMLSGSHDGKQGMSWHAIGHHDQTGVAVGRPEEWVITRIKAGKEVLRVIQDQMHPGLLLVTTELPAHHDTRSGKDFVILNTPMS